MIKLLPLPSWLQERLVLQRQQGRSFRIALQLCGERQFRFIAFFVRAFDGIADFQPCAAVARDGTFDEDQVFCFVDSDDFKVLGGDTGGTHVTGHLLAFENFTWDLDADLWNRANGAKPTHRVSRANRRSRDA
jgi:hypothetical protein